MNRRRFLRGVGSIAIALPFLESLGHRRFARAQTVSAPKRFVCFFQCNGANMDQFWPQGGYGALSDMHFPAERSLYMLRPYRDKLLIPRNVYMSPTGFRGDIPGCDHQKGMGHKLTAQPLDDSGFAQGISVDQYIANQINPAGRPSLTLGVHVTGGGPLGGISYRSAGNPASSEPNPRLAFQDMVGINYGDAQVRDLLSERRKSVLDLVHEDFTSLSAQGLSKSDRDKLDLHFTSIRELEEQLAGLGGAASMACERLDATREAQILNADNGVDVTEDGAFKDMGRMQMDLIALSLACDYTRAATLQWGSGSGGPTFKWDGMNHTYNHHKLSHGSTRDGEGGSDVAGYEGMIADIDRWFAGEFVYLLDKLNAYGEGEGTLLDNSCVLWINELSDGKAHSYFDLPIVMAGSCGGAFRTGRYVDLGSDAPHSKLLTTLVNAVGAGPLDHFGSAEHSVAGEFSELKA